MAAVDVHPRDLKHKFDYLKWDDIYNVEKPFQVLIEIPKDAPDQRKQNIIFHKGDEETVHDVRHNISAYTLDTTGFTYVLHQSAVVGDQYQDIDHIKNTYLPECEQLLQSKIDGVDEIYIYDWRLRRSNMPNRQGKLINYNDPMSAIGPATHVHVDQSPASVVERIRLVFPDRADSLLQGRVRLINLWRPTNGPVENWPLAVSDGSTIQESNLIETDRIRRNFTGCTMFLLHDERVKWHYMSRQDNNELLMFKSFDSKEGVVPYAAHGSFELPDAPPDAKPRESIEVRALVFTRPLNRKVELK
ncbi:hypothetical protein V492_08433 [Pseudogymnoascus sp. VKM F-4246]|nr:hypothetical protein V492_08433 [Pseudogymnoascus sp. VKM F-4246]